MSNIDPIAFVDGLDPNAIRAEIGALGSRIDALRVLLRAAQARHRNHAVAVAIQNAGGTTRPVSVGKEVGRADRS